MCDTQADMEREEKEYAEAEAEQDYLIAEGLLNAPTASQTEMFTPAGHTFAKSRKPSKNFMGSAKACELCNKPFGLGQLVFDAPIPHHTAWAFMCAHCYNFGRENAMKGKVFIYPRASIEWGKSDTVNHLLM